MRHSYVKQKSGWLRSKLICRTRDMDVSKPALALMDLLLEVSPEQIVHFLPGNCAVLF